MKKIAAFLVLSLIVYAIYNDLTAGTLPAASMHKIEAASKEMNVKNKNKTAAAIPYFEHVVKPGDTVLSVLDRISQTPLQVSVTKAVEDFKQLNGGTDPHKIQFGKTYKFPDYRNGN